MTMQKAIPRLVISLVFAAIALLLALNRDRLDPAVLETTIRDLGLLAPVAHVVLFALGTVVFVPGTLFGVAGGMLFGPVWGTLLNLLGATFGATAAFLLARFVARTRSGKRQAVSSTASSPGWKPRGGASSLSSAWYRSSRSTSSTMR